MKKKRSLWLAIFSGNGAHSGGISGSSTTPDLALVQRDGSFIQDRAGNYIVTRV